jgi:hypothetical protein
MYYLGAILPAFPKAAYPRPYILPILSADILPTWWRHAGDIRGGSMADCRRIRGGCEADPWRINFRFILDFRWPKALFGTL